MNGPEYYQSLLRDIAKHERYFMGTCLGLVACLAASFEAAPTDGWRWLVGSLGFLFVALWSLIESRHARLLMQIYLSTSK